MAEQTLKEQTAKGLFWGGVSNGVQQILGLVIGIILLKNLNPSDYGLVGMLAIFTGIAGVIQESGFTAALVNRSEYKHEDYNAVFWFNFSISVFIYVLLFISAPLIAFFYKEPMLVSLSRVLFLSFVFSSLSISHYAFLFKNLMVEERAKIDIFSMILAGSFSIFMALRGFGYWALVVQTLTYNILITVLRWYYSNWRPTFDFNFSPIREMYGFSFKLLLSTIIGQIQNNIFSILVGKYYTKSDVGYYSQGVKWSGMGMQLINGMIIGVMQPVFVQIQDDKNRQVRVFRKTLRFISFISIPILLGLAFISRDFIFVINQEFLPCVPILQLSCISALIMSIVLLYIQFSISMGSSDYYFICSLLFGLIQIITSFAILFYGIYWLAFSMTATTIIYFFIWHYVINNFFSIKLKDVFLDVFPYFAGTLISLTFAWWISLAFDDVYIVLCSKILVSIIVYSLIMKLGNSVIFNDVVKLLLGKICK